MGRRTLLMIASILVAAVGVALIFLYVRTVEQRAEQRVASVEVLVALKDIPAGTSMASAVASHWIESKPSTADVAQGAVRTDFNSDSRFSHVVEAGAIIRQAMFGEADVASKHPEVTKEQALTLHLPLEDRVGGILQDGDHVDVWGIGKEGAYVAARDVRVISIGTDADADLVAFDVDEGTATQILTAQATSTLRLTLLTRKQKSKSTTPTPTTTPPVPAASL